MPRVQLRKKENAEAVFLILLFFISLFNPFGGGEKGSRKCRQVIFNRAHFTKTKGLMAQKVMSKAKFICSFSLLCDFRKKVFEFKRRKRGS